MADDMTNRSLREDQASAVHERIVSAAVAVIEAGEEPQMRSVAAAAQISERTIYRYFATREALQSAVISALRTRASAPMAADVGGLEDYARRLFATFHQNATLTRALVSAKWTSLTLTRTANLDALRAIIDAGFPAAPADARESAAAGLRVPLSAAGWAYLADCGFDLEASITHVQWLIRAVLEKLHHLSGGDHA